MPLLRRRRPVAPRTAGTAPEITGVDPEGRAVVLETSSDSRYLVFLTVDCAECREVWDALASGSLNPDAVITPDPGTQSPRRLAALAPDAMTVVMSTNAWNRYRIISAPWGVQIRSGQIVSSSRLTLEVP